jgi:hypothetical protein
VPGTELEFDAATAFERFILDRATPLLRPSGTRSEITLAQDGTPGLRAAAGTAVARASVDSSSGPASGTLAVGDVYPLLFGAAWKVLDQLVELRLEQTNTPRPSARMRRSTVQRAVVRPRRCTAACGSGSERGRLSGVCPISWPRRRCSPCRSAATALG